MPGYVVPCDGVLLLVEYRHATLYERANRNVPWASDNYLPADRP